MIFSLIRLPQYWFSEDSPTPPFDDFNPQFYYTPREKDPKNKTSGDLSFDQGTCSVNSVYPPRSLGFDLSRSFNSAVYVVGWSPWPSVESIYTKQNKTKQKIKENNQKVSKTGLLFVWINFTWNKQLILLKMEFPLRQYPNLWTPRYLDYGSFPFQWTCVIVPPLLTPTLSLIITRYFNQPVFESP